MIENSEDLNLLFRNIFLVISLIDKADPSDPLRREDYWRQTFKFEDLTLKYGLNIGDSVWRVFLCLLFYMVKSVVFTR